MTAAAKDDGAVSDPDQPAQPTDRANLRALIMAYPWLPAGVALVLSVVGAYLFAGITEHIYRDGWLPQLDTRVLGWTAAVRTDGLETLFAVLTWLGDSLVVVPVAIAAALSLGLRSRDWRPVVLLTVCSAGIGLAVSASKNLIARPRPHPAMAVAQEDGFGFPSGHSAHSAAVYLMVALLAFGVLHRQWTRLAVLTTALLVVVITGLSRIVLGVHAPSDVLAGWLLGASWTLLLVSMTQLSHHVPQLIAWLVARKEQGRPPD